MSSRLQAYQAAQLPLRAQILRECEEMAEFAFARGLRVPPWTVQVIGAASEQPAGAPASPEDLKRLAVAHEALARIVVPATPQSLVLLDEESDSGLSFLGPVPFVRRMTLAAFVCVVAFIALSLSPLINNDKPDAGDILMSSGIPLLVNELFFMSAAGMGAAFHALFEANRFLVQRNFDPRYEVSYWIKFLLGLIAGLIMVTLIPINATAGHGFARPTLAMLGGFSAAAVYRVIARLVETMESMVQGDAKSMVEGRERAAKQKADEEISQHRMKMTTDLVALQQKLSAGASSDDVRRQLNQIVNSVMTGGEPGLGGDDESARATIAVPNMAIVSAPASDASAFDAPAGSAGPPAASALSIVTAPVAAPVAAVDEPRPLGVPDAEDMSAGEAGGPPAAPAAPAPIAVAAQEEAVG
ncbi:MAG: hypothetical protein JWM27_3496 [Gemmatimonadetes bacterium]|nr:hypothetical protein [Gemmatimonadota bacterium]